MCVYVQMYVYVLYGGVFSLGANFPEFYKFSLQLRNIYSGLLYKV